MVGSLGKTIKEMRKLKKIKQKDFANLIGVSERTLFNYESGETIPSLTKLDQISKVLGISKEVLFDTVEGRKIVSFNDDCYIYGDEYCATNDDMLAEQFKPIMYEEIIESSFRSYVSSLIKLSNSSNLKSVHFTSKDYENLIKYCNASILNILELYYASNPIMFNLEELDKDNNKEDCSDE